ncbi:Hypp245 [Branchiostoma lanceolatum]|uniref:Hypp245 protein n=1 Tax=Branchiostoma lanceolatum TaxID=7740 RepID=A0A8J9YNZ3_BRALA|nr:Hypp245 [Branchiostoma lanceolatum]
MAGRESGPGKDAGSEGTRGSQETFPRPSLDPTAAGVREVEPSEIYEEESGVVCAAGSATVASHVDIPFSSMIAHRPTSTQIEQRVSTQTTEFPPGQSVMPTPDWQREAQLLQQGHTRVPPPLPTLHLPLPSEISFEHGFPEPESPSSGHFSVSPSEQSLLSPTPFGRQSPRIRGLPPRLRSSSISGTSTFSSGRESLGSLDLPSPPSFVFRSPLSPVRAYVGTLPHHRLPSPSTRGLSSISEVESSATQPSSAGLQTPAWSPSWPYALSSPPSAADSGRLPSWSSEEASPLPSSPYQLRRPRTPRSPYAAGTSHSRAVGSTLQGRASTAGRKVRGVRSRRQYQRRRGSVSSELSSTESLVSRVSGAPLSPSMGGCLGVKRREKLSSKRRPDPEPTESDRPERRSVYMIEHDGVDPSLLRELFERGEREESPSPTLRNFVIKVISGCLRDEQDVPSYVSPIEIKKEIPDIISEVVEAEASASQPTTMPETVREAVPTVTGSSVEPLPSTTPAETVPQEAVLVREGEGPEVTVAPQLPASGGGTQPYMYLIAPGGPNFTVTIDDIVQAEKCGCDRCDPGSSAGERGAEVGTVEASRSWQVVPPDAIEECTIVLPMQQDIQGKTRYYLIPMSYKQTGHARDCHEFLTAVVNHPSAGQGTRALVSSFWVS